MQKNPLFKQNVNKVKFLFNFNLNRKLMELK